MSVPIEDYALLGDCHTAALVSKHGSIDWLCLPRFDSAAIFAALLGTPDHGHWQIAPQAPAPRVTRSYRDGTLVLETQFATDSGQATLIDCMPPRSGEPHLVRIVRGDRGQVAMHTSLVIRCDYGSIVPWVTHADGGIQAISGPDAVTLWSDIELRGDGLATVADFVVSEGQEVAFVLSWHPSHTAPPPRPDARALVEGADLWWRHWAARCTYQGPWQESVLRSLNTLKALTYLPTGGIVAAPTTSLPEQLGGVRNWDYRYCWIRDATFTLDALLQCGFTQEAIAWRDWLLRAVAGSPDKLSIMYGIRGKRRLPELTLDWLPGYEQSAPVRIGNAAHSQYQLDVYGELIDAMFQARTHGVPARQHAWELQCALLDFLETGWRLPDEGIWEVRGPRQHFTHSKVMAWVAFDRMVKLVEQFDMPGLADRWRSQRDEIHAQVCAQAIDPVRNCFVQHYGAQTLDASLLMIPLVGFLPATDPRMLATIEAIERELVIDGFVQRYPTSSGVDGLPPGEGAFLACSFWLVDNLALVGRRDDAVRHFERLLALRNDVGLLSEEYDPRYGRLVGNFPQAFSHIALVESALNLSQQPAVPRRAQH